MAFTQKIDPTTKDSHQTSPAYMLTFVRYDNIDTFNYLDSTDPKSKRENLVVYNDAVAVTVTNTKSSITSSMSAILRAGDINYATAISPGDYVFVNMVNWEDNISTIDSLGIDINKESLRTRAKAGQAINKYKDGFKGVFKVQRVQKNIRTDPASGTKTYFFDIHAFGFTEFNSTIYYDPQVFSELSKNQAFFMQQFNGWFSGNLKSGYNVQTVIPTLIRALIGDTAKSPTVKLPTVPVSQFVLPPSVGSLLGVPSAKTAADIYNFYLGIWGEEGGGGDPAKGFNPQMKQQSETPSNFYFTPTKLAGQKQVDAEYWNNVKVWSILSKYANTVINEMYTTVKVAPNGHVMPSLIIRQKPFTSNHFQSPTQEKKKKNSKSSKTPATKYLSLPQWYLNPDLVYDFALGKDEAARINFVQIYTRSVSISDPNNRAMQAGTGNFAFDEKSINRHGLKPFLATADFDYPEVEGGSPTKGKEWAELVADWVFSGHLREAGHISCVGIEEPIAVGDNLLFDNIVYHIEAITHSINIDAGSGAKSFRTNLTVSFGTDPKSKDGKPIYPETEHTVTLSKRQESFSNKGEKILPGFSDSQHIAGRENGEDK